MAANYCVKFTNMSRIGKQPINLPAGVSAELKVGFIAIKGPKGALEIKLHPHVTVVQEGADLKVTVLNPEETNDRALWGLFGSLIQNMVEGVTKGFEKKLEMSGIGFKAEVKGKNLVLNIGFSHQVNFAVPAGVEITMEKDVIVVKGIDKGLVGETAARIRALKKPEPYQGKGIKYAGEIIRRKAGKAATKAAS
ncbi:MAG: 50S ribosomal protein L6 [Candidatus Magasanikbacteria bacterium GW2011_GWA2_41_55]|uniref:Large ribosomal subunit protein uL6 n=1 Tax=Candidatus Magasanikbacteria bacterium GW2011_GWA2_41_55 TaxID=1619038 RepID=A0A0G0WLA6_9BACT|nr:MAG: 50S ribosomal protein L6 [Candidatus Magasanikbacteria bacterium GW2011_GWA2_41_55]